MSAAAIFHGEEEEILKNIEDSVWSILLLNLCYQLKDGNSSSFSESSTSLCVGVAVDGAHCITQWQVCKVDKLSIVPAPVLTAVLE